MDYEYKRLRAYADEIGRRIVRRRAGVPVAGRPCGYGADERRTPDSAFPPLPEGGAWGGKRDSHWWFRAHFRVPEEFQGDLWLEFADAKEGFDACNPQFTAYLDKVPVQGLDVNHTRLKLGGMREGVLDIYAYTGSEIDEILHISCSVIETDPAAEALFYDMDVPLGAMEYLPENTEEYRALRAALSESVALLDLRSEECAARTMSLCSKYLRENLYGEREERAAVCCVGHTHIDLAWLWPLRQTPEKAERSFLTALELMREDPAYTFLCSQPQLYEWFEERCPEAFAELKERVAEGRWLAEGGTWIEPDCNLISGESLVRQFWYGSLYFREKFGTESRILWLPDTFGFPANLPQIAKKCGMKFFVTSKLSWNERDRMPHDLFYFRGIDGSEIAAYFLTAQDRIRNADPVNYTTYNASTDAKQIAGTYARFADTDLADEVLLTYGFGDGGGGPTRNNLQQLSRLRRGMPGCPRVLCGAPGGFFERLEKKIEKLTLPVWRGELYFERHRGTLTSIAKNKRNNRRAEFAAMNAEWLCEEAALLCGAEYPKALFDGAWKKILNMQFHDILPGSCIGAVYEETDALYAEVFAELGRAAEAAAAEIGACLPAGYTAAVVNPNGFRTDAYVHTGEGCRLVRGLPPKSIVPLCAEPVRGSVSVSERALENTFVSVRFAPDYSIASVFDKRCGRELLLPGRRANVLQVFDNHAVYEFDAWELKTYFDKKGWEIDDVSEVKLLDDGARKGVYIRRRYLSSEVRQTVWLYEESPRIEFETQADWREPHTIVKALFPVDINAEYVTRDIAFGRCDTPVHANTPWDQERFEICAHKYCDLREGDYGVALLSDCKYGYDFRDGMRLTLFKTASFPFPEADIGRHDFTYALFPHGSDPLYTQVLREATLLNNPPYLQKVIGKGARSAFDPAAGFVSCNGGNVVLETVKCAENGELCAVRVYDYSNCRTRTSLEFAMPPAAAWKCDLRERPVCELKCLGNAVELELAPFEVCTVAVKFDIHKKI